MFAIVENQQNLFIDEKVQYVLGCVLRQYRNAQNARKNALQKRRIRNRSKIDEPNLMLKEIGQVFRNRESNSCFSDSRRSNNRNESPLPNLGTERTHDLCTADHSAQSRRQVITRFSRNSWFRRLRRFSLERHIRYETVTSTDDICDIAGTALTIPQHPPKGRYMHSQVSFVDECLRPHARY